MTNLNEILERGVSQILPDKKSLQKLMQKRKIKLYLGIDPTGSLLTLGHSVVLRKLAQFADLGHEVILLIGNGTVKIGDPTGRDTTRPMLTDKEIEANFRDWKKQASKILDFSKIKIMRNGDWLDKITLPEFIKLMAKTTLQQLTERDMFQERMKKKLPIYGHEILYPMLQGYDSVMLNVDLEIGGTDQTFNMLMGRELQKAYHHKEKWVLTTPLINGLDGRKMSKSYGNYIALTEKPEDMYGKLMRISDDMIIEYLTLLTDISHSEINDIALQLKNNELNPMQAKKKLAYTITAMYHNIKKAAQAQENFEKISQEKGLPEKIEKCFVPHKKISLVDLILQCHLAKSKNEAKRLVDQKAVSLNNEILNDWHREITPQDKQILKTGKRNFVEIITKKE